MTGHNKAIHTHTHTYYREKVQIGPQTLLQVPNEYKVRPFEPLDFQKWYKFESPNGLCVSTWETVEYNY